MKYFLQYLGNRKALLSYFVHCLGQAFQGTAALSVESIKYASAGVQDHGLYCQLLY